MRPPLSLRVKLVRTATEIPELDASRRIRGWKNLEYGDHLMLYVSWCPVLIQGPYLTPANSDTVVVYCPLNHSLQIVSLIKGH